MAGLINASIPNGQWIGEWFVEKNVNATVSIKSPLGQFGNITSPVFVSWILSHVEAGVSASDIWTYATRTLTNLNNTRAALIDRLDVLLSSRADQTSVNTIDGIADSILVDTTAIKGYVDTEISDIHTDIGTLSSSVSSTFTPYGYLGVETYTRVTPTQNVWYTAFDNTGVHGQVVALRIVNGDAATKSFDVRITIDGIALTRSTIALTTGSGVYLYITTILDDTLTSSSAAKTFTNDLEFLIHYRTSLKLEYRTIHADVDSMTVLFRRNQ